MPFKPSKRLLWIGGLFTVSVIALMTAGAFILPFVLQSWIIPRLVAGSGLETEDVHVRRVGWWGADLGPIRIRARNAPALTLAAVQIDYTPWTLLQGRIEGITLGGLDLDVTVAADGVCIGGFRLPVKDSPVSGATSVPDLKNILPVGLGRFTVLQSRVTVDWKGRRYLIPLDLRLETAELGRGILRGRADVAIWGDPIRVEAVLEQPTNSVAVNLQIDRFGLDSLCRLGLLPGAMAASGFLGLKAQTTLQLTPLKMTGLEVSGQLTETQVVTPQGSFRNLNPTQGDARPVDLSITARVPDRILYACGPFQFDGPFKAVVEAIKGELAAGNPNGSMNARVQILFPSQSLESGLSWQKDLPMDWQLEAVQRDKSAIDFKGRASSGQPLAVGLKSFQLTNDSWQIDFSGHYADQRIAADSMLTIGKIKLTLPDGHVTIPAGKISSTMSMPSPSVPSASTITARATFARVRSDLGDTVISLPEIQIDAQGQADPTGPWAFQSRLKTTGGRMLDKAHDVALQGLQLDLPLQWPPAREARSGHLELKTLQWKDRQLGGVKGRLQQKGRSLEIDLEHRSKLFAGLNVLINSRLDAAGIHADIRVPSYRPAQSVDLGPYFPDAAGVMANGRVEAGASVDIVNGESSGRAEFRIDQATLVQQDRDVRLEGIAMALRINDIAAVKSAPRQKLQVQSLKFGNLAAENLDVDFQLEDRQTFFLEKASLKWCQGRIYTAAIRVHSDKDDYDVTLFCDRLNLAMVLQQLGAAEAGGEGTVNGRIPLRWVDGQLSFDNGFLYSTPGQTGQIQLAETEALLKGVPPGSPQHTQLDIATEALKDYTYQWAKLNVQSENNQLLLKLQLDGKPNRLLPFAYDQQLGQFKRVSGEGQAEFKGISIDLNFKSPLNEIVHYKDFLNRN